MFTRKQLRELGWRRVTRPAGPRFLSPDGYAIQQSDICHGVPVERKFYALRVGKCGEDFATDRKPLRTLKRAYEEIELARRRGKTP